MKNKTILITGGNAGIGFQTALKLADKGASLILGCRNPERAQAAVQQIRQQTRNEHVHALELDLSSLASVRQFARLVQNETDKLDALVNNAGLIADAFRTTQDGFEYQIGVNHLGHFLLTSELLSLLEAAPEARVVTVASAAHKSGKINFDSFSKPSKRYSPLAAYGQSKLANILFAKELARRYPHISSYALHPGVVYTEFGSKTDNKVFRWLWNMSKPFLLSPEQGAQTSVYLASHTERPEPNGGYFEKSKPTAPSTLAQDEKLAAALWEHSQTLVNATP